MNSYLKNAQSIRQQATKVIADLNLLSLLSTAGEVKIVGSYAYDLMTWPDLDLDVLANSVISEYVVSQIIEKLFLTKKLQKITIIDNRVQLEAGRPKSIYLGLQYTKTSKDGRKSSWKIDIRFICRKDVISGHVEELIKEKLTEENKLTILEIKNQIHSLPEYHHTFFSTDVYQAVLENGIKDYEGFKAYLLSQGVELIK